MEPISMYDHVQRFFYYVMLESDNPDAWKDLGGKGFGVPDRVSCDWTAEMLAQTDIAEGISNYNAYVAPGEGHTVTVSNKMYRTSADGIDFLDWLGMMLNRDAAWESEVCIDCEEPPTAESPVGIQCP